MVMQGAMHSSIKYRAPRSHAVDPHATSDPSESVQAELLDGFWDMLPLRASGTAMTLKNNCTLTSDGISIGVEETGGGGISAALAFQFGPCMTTVGPLRS